MQSKYSPVQSARIRLTERKYSSTKNPTGPHRLNRTFLSEYGHNFLKTMLRLGHERNSLGIVSDQRGCPTYAGDIADAIIELINAQADGGIYHYCGDNEVSWFEFAQEIFGSAKDAGKLSKIPELNAIATELYPTPAKRPVFSTLDTTKIQKIGISPSNWRLAISDVIAKL